MGHQGKSEARDEEQLRRWPAATESRRHRPASELRFAKVTSPVARSAAAIDLLELPPSAAPTGTLTSDLRTALWEIARGALFAPHAGALREDDAPASRTVQADGARGAVIRRVWTAAPIGGAADRIPEDVTELLEGWFSLVERADVYAFLEAVHDAIEAPLQPRFATTVNAALERGLSEHRFVLARLVPMASRADAAAIERAFAACRSARWVEVEEQLQHAFARLAAKPEADSRGAINASLRAVRQAAAALTKEHYIDLDDALDDLAAKGHIAGVLVSAYTGLFGSVASSTRKTTANDARLVLVMCAGLIAHLASQLD
ncbi:MAG: hypothetical protein BGO98_47845 [Myxococcales bacterium 68-20]|nr:hypothetical protein [Myxococcales bacterium]OJY29562.1 MAG: hypothetical protein BGO98_47845 [Myxococcales bacterium 68-20]